MVAKMSWTMKSSCTLFIFSTNLLHQHRLYLYRVNMIVMMDFLFAGLFSNPQLMLKQSVDICNSWPTGIFRLGSPIIFSRLFYQISKVTPVNCVHACIHKIHYAIKKYQTARTSFWEIQYGKACTIARKMCHSKKVCWEKLMQLSIHFVFENHGEIDSFLSSCFPSKKLVPNSRVEALTKVKASTAFKAQKLAQ